ncbi:hypothetical protein [Herbidospora cretacea]|uniref:hypothetical protein n=1 Tax=Herbidospora cretacea TaxID=28444 RepID=UPI0004C32742|nr:hypothetical protein [Herbidospora cretacea]
MTTMTHADEDWRFAELVMRAWTEPDLAARYEDDPAGTLAQFGIDLGDDEAPPLAAGGDPLHIADLSKPSLSSAKWTYCG